MKLVAIVNFHLSRFCYDTCVEELIPRVGQPGKTPVDTIGIGGRIGLLFRWQHFALTDGVDWGMCIFPEFRESSDVYEVNRYFHWFCHIACNYKKPSVCAYFQWGGRVEDWGGFLSTLYTIWVVPILTPITIAYVKEYNGGPKDKISNIMWLFFFFWWKTSIMLMWLIRNIVVSQPKIKRTPMSHHA